MPGCALSAQLQPENLLIGHGHAEYELAGRIYVEGSNAALIEHVFRVELTPVIFNHPACALRATRFFVAISQEEDVARRHDSKLL